MIKAQASGTVQESSDDPKGYIQSFVSKSGFGPKLPGLKDLETQEYFTALSQNRRGNIDITYTVGADADINQNGELERSEAVGLFPFGTRWAAKYPWQVLRNINDASLLGVSVEEKIVYNTLGTPMSIPATVYTFIANQASTPKPNDIVVTTTSANPTYGKALGNLAGNHATVKNGDIVRQILENIVKLRSE